MHVGIDYGSKLAGTTVITWNENHTLKQSSSLPKRDADKFLLEIILDLKPESIFIDAPLSLPKVYCGRGDDYHYRECDRALSAMSPMFLGGLTARAMKIASMFKRNEIFVYETYPKGLVQQNEVLSSLYTKKDSSCIPKLISELDSLTEQYNLPKSIDTMHHLDSLLAWISGYRFQNDKHLEFGSKEEGIIII